MQATAELSYCASEVRRHDADRFLTTLFAPKGHREDLFALYAFNLEISKTREIVNEAMLGAIRLQWWREAIEAIYTNAELRKHAVVEALAETVNRRGLTREHFDRLIDGRMVDLEIDTHDTLEALTDYTDATSGSLIILAMEALAGTLEEAAVEAGRHVGNAWALTGVLRAMPHFLQQGRVMLPKDLIEAHDIERREMLYMKSSDSLAAAVSDVAALALRELEAARKLRSSLPRAACPALLLGVLAESYIGRIRRAEFNVFDPSIGTSAGLATARLAYRTLIGRY